MVEDNIQASHLRKHHFHSFTNRGIYSLALVVSALAMGTFGMHWIEGFGFLDAFYFTSMIATGQGPAPDLTPATPAGKIFTSFLAFFSAGSMVASFGFLFGPFFGRLWRIGLVKIEDEIEHLAHHEKKQGGS